VGWRPCRVGRCHPRRGRRQPRRGRRQFKRARPIPRRGRVVGRREKTPPSTSDAPRAVRDGPGAATWPSWTARGTRGSSCGRDRDARGNSVVPLELRCTRSRPAIASDAPSMRMHVLASSSSECVAWRDPAHALAHGTGCAIVGCGPSVARGANHAGPRALPSSSTRATVRPSSLGTLHSPTPLHVKHVSARIVRRTRFAGRSFWRRPVPAHPGHTRHDSMEFTTCRAMGRRYGRPNRSV
jgi:hypothetical protein